MKNKEPKPKHKAIYSKPYERGDTIQFGGEELIFLEIVPNSRADSHGNIDCFVVVGGQHGKKGIRKMPAVSVKRIRLSSASK